MRPCGWLARLCNLYLSGVVWAFSIVLCHNGWRNNKEPDQISWPARLHFAAGLVEYSTVNGQFKDCFFPVCLFVVDFVLVYLHNLWWSPDALKSDRAAARLDPPVVRLWLDGRWFDPWVKLQYAGYWTPVVQMVISADEQLEHCNADAAIFQMNFTDEV